MTLFYSKFKAEMVSYRIREAHMDSDGRIKLARTNYRRSKIEMTFYGNPKAKMDSHGRIKATVASTGKTEI